VPLMLDHVTSGRLSISRLVDLMCAGPARVYGALNKGRLAAGYDADFTVVDLKRQRMIRNDWLATPAGWTPFDGTVCTGWPVMTIIRGHVAMREDEVQGAPQGKPVSFADTHRA
jgi:dihydroorotase